MRLFRGSLILFLLVAMILPAAAQAPGNLMENSESVSSSRYIAVAAGYWFGAALHEDGSVWSWGHGGNQGNGVPLYGRGAPVPVWGLTGVKSIACGPFRTLAVKEDGTVWTWGNNNTGILGDGSTNSHYFPVAVPSLTNVTATAPGYSHTLVLKDDGTAWAWGSNSHGQLGDGTTNSTTTPSQIPGLTQVIAIAAGQNHSVALKGDGTVWIWGIRVGAHPGTNLTPTQIEGIVDISAVAAGLDHLLLLSKTGNVYSLGSNSSGQLGTGSTVDSPVPLAISGLSQVTKIAAGHYHSLAISEGNIWGWGRNDSGQAGQLPSYAIILQPERIDGATGSTAIAGGNNFSLAVNNLQALSWGSNYQGQLGVMKGMYYSTHIPEPVTDYVPMDPHLKARYLEALGRSDGHITREEMAQLVGIFFPGESLYTLAGLEFAPNLQYLDISYCPLDTSENFPLFAYTPDLRYLNVSGLSIYDLNPITWLSKLEVLAMDQTELTSIEFLTNLTNLEVLSLWYNNIRDISPLSSLTKLRYLDLDYCSVMFLDPLLDLPMLEEVWLASNVFDSSPFSSNREIIRTLMHRGVAVHPGPMTIQTGRLSGSDRYATAAAISASGWSSAETVVLARGDNYADALAGVPLAYQLDAPVLLTQPTLLTAATQAEIQRLGASKVVILGGTGAVTAAIETQLRNSGLSVERIAGANRFATAAEIARKMGQLGAPMEKAVVVYGLNFPDALAAAPYAAINGYPILLTGTNTLDPDTELIISELGIPATVVAGGTGVISDAAMNLLPNPQRVFDNDRYGTAVALARYFVQDVEISRLYVATGTNFADAITGAALAAKNGHGMVLVHNQVPASVHEYLGDYLPCGITAFGGTGAVSSLLLDSLSVYYPPGWE